MNNEITKIKDRKIIDQLNAKLYIKKRKWEIKTKLTNSPKYMDRSNNGFKMLDYNIYIPVGEPCLIFVTCINTGYERQITVLIKNKIYYTIGNLMGVPNNTIIFGYITALNFFAMDLLRVNGIQMNDIKFGCKRDKKLEYVRTLKVRRMYLEKIVNEIKKIELNSVSVYSPSGIQPFNTQMQKLYSMSEIGQLKHDTLFFYNKYYNNDQILIWVNRSNLILRTECTRNVITENMDHKIYNPTYKTYRNVQTNTTNGSDVLDDQICMFEIQGNTKLKYIGASQDPNAKISNTFEYVSAINFYKDCITYNELVKMYA